MRTSILFVCTTVILAGCASEPHRAEGLDTGDIPPSESKTLLFDASTTMHCHPHPWMTQNVTLTDDPPSEVHVHIVDGMDENAYRYEPEKLTIGKGSRVTYHNHGNFTHTATQKTDDAQNAHA